MKILNSVMVVLAVIASASSAVAETVNSPEWRELATLALESNEAGRTNMKKLMKLLQIEVDQEILKEANAANLSVDKYLSDDASFETFNKSLENMKEKISSLDMPDLVIFTLKSGLRFQSQANVRFIPNCYIKCMETAQNLMQPALDRLPK